MPNGVDPSVPLRSAPRVYLGSLLKGNSRVDFAKYHGLGNDYLVVTSAAVQNRPLSTLIPILCDRHRGPGADGVLVDEGLNAARERLLRIFNPDGSEAEKSGNGLRIFARYLWDRAEVGRDPFTILTAGGPVSAVVDRDGHMVTIDMGEARFSTLHGRMMCRGEELEYHSVTLGNPHCVTFGEVTPERAREFGPLIERDRRFPDRTNVQFAHVMGRTDLTIEIWERGAGYTLASGSSACASAAVARKLGLVDEEVTVRMPGGTLAITVWGDDYQLRMCGPVVRVMEGRTDPEIFAGLEGST